MKISYSNHFKKSFAKLDRVLQKRVYEAIKNIPNGDIKKLKGKKAEFYRLRVSKYRILFKMDDKIEILKLDSRGGIYK